jgi:hypothetical protein
MALDIKRELSAVNRRDYNFLDNLPEDEAKTFNAYVFMRYISNPRGDRDLHEWSIERTNEMVNKNHWDLSKNHRNLLWKLSASVGTGMNIGYQYLASGKKEKANKIEKLLAELYPAMKMSEIKLLATMMDKQDKEELFDKMGFDKKQRKAYE